MFESLLRRFQGPLFGFVGGLVRDDEQARDIAQDVFCDAWRLTQREQPPFTRHDDEEMIRRWLFHAAYWRAVSALRRRRVIRWESLDTSQMRHPEAPRPFEDRIAEGEVLRASLASLTPEDAACILLNVVQGFTTPEIATIVGISPQAAKKRLTRAKQRLRAAYFAQDAQPQEIAHP